MQPILSRAPGAGRGGGATAICGPDDGRGSRQIRADTAADVASRRDGRPDAGLRPDSRGDDGHGRCLPDSTDASSFLLSREAMLAVAIIGTVTLFYSGFSALVQRDIKRVLAYSTISQIGYMFLALGVGAWSGRDLPLLTHAFFKALLFLSAGVVIDAQHDEHDLFKMGGLRRHFR